MITEGILEHFNIADVDFEALNEIETSSNGLSGFELYYPKFSRNPEIRKIYDLIKKVSKSNASVLIEGETGTGKEVIARYIHYGKGDVTTLFVGVNCAAISPTLFESELFGYEPGAFTGGNPNGQKGKFELAGQGTLFLDDLLELSPNFQAKILRVLEEREYYRIG